MSKTSRLCALEGQVRRLERRLEHLDRVSDRGSLLRVGAMLGALGATGLAYYFLGIPYAVLGAALGALAFGAAVYAHRRIERAIARLRLWMRLKEAQIARATLDWGQVPGGATPRPRPDHPFEEALALVGPRSFHRLLDRATTHDGSRRLRDWLAAPASELARARRRQALVRELAPMHLFRDRLVLNARGRRGDLHHTWQAGPLLDWLGHVPGADGGPPGQGTPDDLVRQRGWLLAFGTLVALNAGLLAANLAGLLPPLWRISVVLYLGLWWFRVRATEAVWNEALSLRAALDRLSAAFRQLETFGYGRKPHLRVLCAPFLDPARRPSRYPAQLTLLVAAMGLRQNLVLGLLLNLVLPWDAYLTYRLGRGLV